MFFVFVFLFTFLWPWVTCHTTCQSTPAEPTVIATHKTSLFPYTLVHSNLKQYTCTIKQETIEVETYVNQQDFNCNASSTMLGTLSKISTDSKPYNVIAKLSPLKL